MRRQQRRPPRVRRSLKLIPPFRAATCPTLLNAEICWTSLVVAVIVLVALYAVLRGRLGLVLTAMRDDETGARSIGARVSRAQLLVFVIAAAGPAPAAPAAGAPQLAPGGPWAAG